MEGKKIKTLNKKTRMFILILISILGLLLIGLVMSKQLTQIKADDKSALFAIENTNYTSWEAENLSTAKDEVKSFLDQQKGTDKNRPYKENKTWTEGSLAALEKAYQSSLTAQTGVSSDLSRMLLIETVRKLEKNAKIAQYDPVLKSLNNFPNDKGEYEIEYDLSTVLSLPKDGKAKYDIMFVLDWSGSMNGILQGLPGYPNEGIPASQPRLHAKHMITTLSQLVLNNYAGSRVRLFGLNAPSQNGKVHVNLDTGFISNSPGWETKIKNAYNVPVDNNEDNQVGNLKYVVPLMKAERDPDAVPVIVYLTDFQLAATGYPTNSTVNNPVIDYRNILTEFASLSPVGDQGPIYLAVRYDHNGNYNPITKKARWAGGPIETRGEPMGYTYDMLQDDVVKNRKNWNWLAVTAIGRTEPKPTPPSNAATVTEDFMKMFTQALPVNPSRAYKADVNLQKFSYITDSHQSTGGSTISLPTKKELVISNSNSKDKDVADSGSFKTTFADTGMFTMGTASSLGDLSNGVKFDASEYLENNRTFNQLPNLFHPFTESAVEMYMYKGTGVVTDPANYELKKTIVGSNYKLYSGKNDYLLKDDRLSSVKYGKMFSKEEVLAIIKEQLGVEEYQKLNFTGTSGNLTESSKKMTFDASQNVYKVYAESNESNIVVQYYDESTGQKIKTDKTLTGVVGTGYQIKPLSDEIIPDFDYVRFEGAPLVGNYTKETQTIKLFYRRSEVELKIYFKDEDDNEIKPAVTLLKKPKQLVDLTNEAEVSTVVKAITDDLYELLTPPADETKVEIVVGKNERTYIFKGQVAIGATNEMLFKTGVIQSRDQELEYASTGPFKLNIADKRGRTAPNEGFKRGQFTINSSLSKPFKHEVSGDVLKDAQIIYNDGEADHAISDVNGVKIYSNNTARPQTSYELELANPTDKKEGLKLLVPKGSGAIKGRYKAEITWELVQEP